MKVKNISGAVKVVFVGTQKIRLNANESRDFDDATGNTLIREFSGELVRDEYIREVDKLLISEPVVGEGQEVIQEKTTTKKRKRKNSNSGE